MADEPKLVRPGAAQEKAIRALQASLSVYQVTAAELRRLAGAKAALATQGGRRSLFAHGGDAAAYNDELEDVLDAIAWHEAMLEALVVSPENFEDLTAREIVAGWRIVRDHHGAAVKFILSTLGGQRESPNFDVRFEARPRPDQEWRRTVITPGSTLVQVVYDALQVFMDRTPNRMLYLEMSRALQAALQARMQQEPLCLPEVDDPGPSAPRGSLN